MPSGNTEQNVGDGVGSVWAHFPSYLPVKDSLLFCRVPWTTFQGIAMGKRSHKSLTQQRASHSESFRFHST